MYARKDRTRKNTFMTSSNFSQTKTTKKYGR